MQIGKITVSRQAERLEKAGWIKREDRGGDARAYQLKLSGRARRIIRDLDRRADRLRDDYLKSISLPRRSILLAGLTVIKNNLLRMAALPR